MSRSLWKGPFVAKSVLKALLISKKKNKTQNLLKTRSRSTQICPDFVNSRFRVYNGKEFSSLLITPEMIGHKLGEFVSTRARYEYKKKKKK